MTGQNITAEGRWGVMGHWSTESLKDKSRSFAPLTPARGARRGPKLLRSG